MIGIIAFFIIVAILARPGGISDGGPLLWDERNDL
jgi:hypothetical protein